MSSFDLVPLTPETDSESSFRIPSDSNMMNVEHAPHNNDDEYENDSVQPSQSQTQRAAAAPAARAEQSNLLPHTHTTQHTSASTSSHTNNSNIRQPTLSHSYNNNTRHASNQPTHTSASTFKQPRSMAAPHYTTTSATLINTNNTNLNNTALTRPMSSVVTGRVSMYSSTTDYTTPSDQDSHNNTYDGNATHAAQHSQLQAQPAMHADSNTSEQQIAATSHSSHVAHDTRNSRAASLPSSSSVAHHRTSSTLSQSAAPRRRRRRVNTVSQQRRYDSDDNDDDPRNNNMDRDMSGTYKCCATC